MEMATNTPKHLAAMPLQQISQLSPTTHMSQIQILESSRNVRKITAVSIIINSNTGGMLVLNDSPQLFIQLWMRSLVYVCVLLMAQ